MTRLGSMMPMPCMADALKVKPPSRSSATGANRKNDRMVMMENKLMLSKEPFEPCRGQECGIYEEADEGCALSALVAMEMMRRPSAVLDICSPCI